MNKTPVTILQELMVRHNITPQYDLLPSEGVGTHLPTFIYRVIAGQVQAIGKARSKKDAKHEAARVALEKLAETGVYHPDRVPARPAPSSPVSSPMSSSPSKIEVNAIGILQDLCAENNIPQPEFKLIADVGPPHLRQFTLECKIGKIAFTATDTTKKKAKQLAAQKMLHRVTDSLPEVIAEFVNYMPTQTPALPHEELVATYNELSVTNKTKKNLGNKISAYPYAFKTIMHEKGLIYQDLWQNILSEDEAGLQDVLDKLELRYFLDFLENNGHTIAFLSINSDPEFVASGMDQSHDSALSSAINNAFKFLKIMTK